MQPPYLYTSHLLATRHLLTTHPLTGCDWYLTPQASVSPSISAFGVRSPLYQYIHTPQPPHIVYLGPMTLLTSILQYPLSLATIGIPPYHPYPPSLVVLLGFIGPSIVLTEYPRSLADTSIPTYNILLGLVPLSSRTGVPNYSTIMYSIALQP